MKLIGYKNIKGIITVETGLHIGGSTGIIEIGGQDNPVIKHPVTREPYIPGSSLKGKMRSLLEWKLGKIDSNRNSSNFGDVHKWCGKIDCPICVIFGASSDKAGEEKNGPGPTRLIVRDSSLNPDFVREEQNRNEDWTVFDLTEDKSENSINRITARANPRNFERVVAGVKFDFDICYRVFSKNGDNGNDDGGNNDESLFEHVLDGLRLIERDTLGGAGSRGCGKVSFLVYDSTGVLKSMNEVTATDFPTTM